MSFDDFKKVTIDEKEMFDKVYGKYPPLHSDLLLTTMVSWDGYCSYRYLMVDGCLLVSNTQNGDSYFRPPIGPRNDEIATEYSHLAKREGGDHPLSLFTPRDTDWYQELFPKLEFFSHRNYFEYVYRASDLADLPGKEFAKIRNKVNRFHREHSFTIESIDDQNMDEVNCLLHRWCLWKNCGEDRLLQNEKIALLRSMEHFTELGLKGIAIRIEDRLQGVSIYEDMGNDTAVVHYEKAIPDFKGIYQVINQEMAKRLANEGFEYINRQSDMGIEGLRDAKLNYNPHHMVEVSHVPKEKMAL